MNAVVLHTHGPDCRGCHPVRPSHKRSAGRLHFKIEDILRNRKACLHINRKVVTESFSFSGRYDVVLEGGQIETCLDCLAPLGWAS